MSPLVRSLRTQDASLLLFDLKQAGHDIAAMPKADGDLELIITRSEHLRDRLLRDIQEYSSELADILMTRQRDLPSLYRCRVPGYSFYMITPGCNQPMALALASRATGHDTLRVHSDRI